MTTKTTAQKVAAELLEARDWAKQSSVSKDMVMNYMTRHIADALEDANPSFDRERFYDAAGYML